MHGIKPHLYVEQLDVRMLQGLGLAHVQPGEAPDVNVRVPLAPQAVFRAAVRRHGTPVADILQVWLDVGNHPARGQAQASEIEHRLLAPLLAAGLATGTSRAQASAAGNSAGRFGPWAESRLKYCESVV